MRRITHIILGAGLAGAVSATVLQSALSLPAQAGAQPTAGASGSGVATVDVLKLLEWTLETDAYAGARDAAGDVWNDQLNPLGDELQTLRQQITDMDPSDPAAQGLYQQYQSLQQRVGSLQQQANVALDKMSAEQLADAYKSIHEAVQVVAEAEGYDRVFASRMSTDDLNAENTNVIVQEVLLRPVLRNAGGEDITELVRVKLGLPEPAAPEQPAPEGPAPEEPADQPAADPGAGEEDPGGGR